jgi:hypothetical protein
MTGTGTMAMDGTMIAVVTDGMMIAAMGGTMIAVMMDGKTIAAMMDGPMIAAMDGTMTAVKDLWIAQNVAKSAPVLKKVALQRDVAASFLMTKDGKNACAAVMDATMTAVMMDGKTIAVMRDGKTIAVMRDNMTLPVNPQIMPGCTGAGLWSTGEPTHQLIFPRQICLITRPMEPVMEITPRTVLPIELVN